MNLQLKQDRRPLYVQAVEVLKTMIIETPYEPGEQLPPEHTLSQQLGISRTTLRMALGHLELQGLIERRQGVGTFVTASRPQRLGGGLQFLSSVQSLAKAAGLVTQTVQREVTQVAATEAWAEDLDIPPATPLLQVACAIAIEGRPVAYLRSLIPADKIDAEALTQSEGSLLDFLTARGEIEPTYTHSRIYALNADATLAAILQVAKNSALIHLREIYFDEHDAPAALSFNYFVSERFDFYIRRQIS